MMREREIPPAVQRALFLANTGECSDIRLIEARLSSEGFVDGRRQLADYMRDVFHDSLRRGNIGARPADA